MPTSMKIPADPTASQSADESVTSVEALTVRRDGVRVSYLPGSKVEVTLDLDGRLIFADAQTVRSLFLCLDEIFGPLAESLRAAQRAAALADCGVAT